MASLYGYITVANLEAYTGIDYETTSATYDNTFVEATISIAERAVNTMCIEAPSSTTDGVYVATIILSERLMRNVMVIDGYAEESPDSIIAFFDKLIEVVLKNDVYSPTFSIPMSGASYHKPDSRMFL